VVGAVLADILAQIVPASLYGPPGYSQDAYSAAVPLGSFVVNQKMLGTGGSTSGGATGSVATGWTLAANTIPSGGSIVGAKATDTRPTSRGEWQQITMSGSSAGAAQIYRAAFISGIAGREMELSCGVECDSDGWAAGGIGSCYHLGVTFYNVSNATVGYAQIFPNVANQPKAQPPDGMLYMRNVNVPATATYFILSFRVFGVGVVRVTNIDLRMLPE